MAREQGKILTPGDYFPHMEIKTTDNDVFVLPNDLNKKWGILLFYRGYW